MHYAMNIKTARLEVVLAAIDAGTGAGYLEIGTTGMTLVLATIPLASPCGTVTDDVLTFYMPQSDTSADATGTAVEARIRDSDDNDCITGMTVGTSTADIIVNSTSITSTQNVSIVSASITHAA